MTLEQAIERVEGWYNSERKDCMCGECVSLDADLTRVLAAAKRPYVLGEGSRKELQELLESARLHPYPSKRAAITAALNLAAAPSVLSEGSRKTLEGMLESVRLAEDRMDHDGPVWPERKALEEALSLSPPFTREEWDDLAGAVMAACSEFCVSSDGCQCYELATKVRAYLESLPSDPPQT